jgi:ribosomal-protein-alanine N-acetyltransferase
MVNIKVRPVNLKDLPELEAIERSSFIDPYPGPLLKVLATLVFGDFLVAVIDGKVVGYIASISEKNKTVHIASIAVHSSYRGMGVAKKLLESLLKILRKRDVCEVKLEVRKSNIPAQNLYRSFGFKHVYTIKNYYEDGEDAAVMKLQLK